MLLDETTTITTHRRAPVSISCPCHSIRGGMGHTTQIYRGFHTSMAHGSHHCDISCCTLFPKPHGAHYACGYCLCCMGGHRNGAYSSARRGDTQTAARPTSNNRPNLDSSWRIGPKSWFEDSNSLIPYNYE